MTNKNMTNAAIISFIAAIINDNDFFGNYDLSWFHIRSDENIGVFGTGVHLCLNYYPEVSIYFGKDDGTRIDVPYGIARRFRAFLMDVHGERCPDGVWLDETEDEDEPSSIGVVNSDLMAPAEEFEIPEEDEEPSPVGLVESSPVTIASSQNRPQIRYIVGDMPFDRGGYHATGRELYNPSTKMWDAEYQDDESWICDWEVTEEGKDYEARYLEWQRDQIPDPDADDDDLNDYDNTSNFTYRIEYVFTQENRSPHCYYSSLSNVHAELARWVSIKDVTLIVSRGFMRGFFKYEKLSDIYRVQNGRVTVL